MTVLDTRSQVAVQAQEIADEIARIYNRCRIRTEQIELMRLYTSAQQLANHLARTSDTT